MLERESVVNKVDALNLGPFCTIHGVAKRDVLLCYSDCNIASRCRFVVACNV